MNIFTSCRMDTVRRCQVKLLDDKKIDISVNNKQTTTELIAEISRQYHLTETEYFGVFYEENDERMWLPSDKKLFDQEVFKRDSLPVLFFGVRFVFKSFLWLQNSTTVLLFFLSTRLAIYRGIIDTNDNTLFQLAGLVVQAFAGDYMNDEAAINTIKRVCVLPKRVIERNPSRKHCEDQIIGFYKGCRELMRGLCIVKYMMLAENLPSYGSHYYLVRNKNNVPAYLGISFVGISVYEYHDRESPIKIYYWKQLENLYYRDRKFSLEVHDLEMSNSGSSPALGAKGAVDSDDKLNDAIHDPSTQMSVGRRIPPTPNIKVRAWFTNSPQLCKAIWSMAVAQHQFYLDKRNSRQIQSLQINDLVRELNSITMNLTTDLATQNGSLSRSNSEVTGVEQNEKVEADVQQLMGFMKQRKQQLENLLEEKKLGVRQLTALENQITGGMSDDPSEKTEIKYQVVDELLNEQTQEITKLNELKQEHETQTKIVMCAKKLLHDQATGNSSLLDSALKQRFEFYTCVKEKLDRLMKLIETEEKDIQLRYPYANTSPLKSSTANSGSPPANTLPQRYHNQNSPSPTQLNRTSSYKRALVKNQRTVPSSITAPGAISSSHPSELDNQVFLPPTLDRSQSSDRLGLPPESPSGPRQHTAYILQPSTTNAAGNGVPRNRVRDRKLQSSLRHNQKSTSTSNTMLDDRQASSNTSAHMQSLDRRHVRGGPHNTSMTSSVSTNNKGAMVDIYGSLERNKHSKVSVPSLHAPIGAGVVGGNGLDRDGHTDSQAHDFYHLTPTGPAQSNTTSTIVTVGAALQQQQQNQNQNQTSSFDHVDSMPPTINRYRRPPPLPVAGPSVFQPHFDPSTAPKDSYYTISGSKDVSPHPHTHHIRGLVADNFYGGTQGNKPMQRYDTSPLLVDHVYPSSRTNQQQPQPYNRTQSSVAVIPTGRTSNGGSQPSALLFRPHSAQSSSSQSSGPNSGSLHVAEEFTDDMLVWLANNHGNSATLV